MKMNKNIITIIILLSSATACSLQGNTCTESVAASRSEEKDANSVEAILTQLKQKTTNLTSYRAELEYRFKQPLLESETLRKGALYYQKSDEESMLRVNFQTLKQDDEKERKYAEHFIFDGIWLTRIDYQIKKAERRQLAEPNKPADPFELASRDLPVIGFTKIEDLKKQFEIKLVPSAAEGLVQQNKAEAETSFHLHLKVKPDSKYKDWPAIDLWIDKKLYLPAKIIAVTTEEDIYEIKFLKPVVNKKIDAKVFKFDIPKDFTIEIIPLKKQETEARPERSRRDRNQKTAF
jgi:outer membrane lipoprotein-sorting protein